MSPVAHCRLVVLTGTSGAESRVHFGDGRRGSRWERRNSGSDGVVPVADDVQYMGASPADSWVPRGRKIGARRPEACDRRIDCAMTAKAHHPWHVGAGRLGPVSLRLPSTSSDAAPLTVPLRATRRRLVAEDVKGAGAIVDHFAPNPAGTGAQRDPEGVFEGGCCARSCGDPC